jgi:DNA-binding NarL/FixJ family response regulator
VSEHRDPQRPTVIVAEDSVLLREGLVSLLERFGFAVQAAVSGAEELLDAASVHRPQLVLTDVRMPPGFRDEGLRAAIELRRREPGLPVMVLSQYVEHVYATQLLAAGESGLGYLLKDRVTDVRTLIAALHEVLAGGTVVDHEVVRRLLSRRRAPLGRLTDRERETLALMAQGRSNAAIAAELVVTEATVAKHIRNLFDKLDLPPTTADHRRVLAVITYLQEGDGLT